MMYKPWNNVTSMAFLTMVYMSERGMIYNYEMEGGVVRIKV